MKNLKYYLLISSLALVFSGCGGMMSPSPEKKPVVKQETPSWINSPQKDDSKYMYGVAIEEDRDGAIKSALNDMVSKLGTTIQSSYESNQEVQGAYSKTNVKNQIKSDIAKIKINNYEIVKSQKVSYREFAVMIRTDKEKFAKGIIESIKSKKEKITLKLDSIKGRDILTRYNTKKELLDEARSLVPNALVVAELKSVKNFDKKEYLDFAINLEKDFINEGKSLNFYVVGNKKSSTFVAKLKNFLANKSFNIANQKNANSVVVKMKTTDDIASRRKIAVIKVDLKVFNNSKRVGGNTIILKERYNGSKSNVYKNASIHFEADLESEKMNEIIGIKLNTK